MTVSTTTSRADYTGNGVTTAFTVPFYFLDNSHLLVLRTVIATGVSTTLALGTDYSVTGAGVGAGGTLTCTVAPTSAQKISILRNVPLTQLIHYVPNDPFPAATHEQGLDQLTMEMQQLSEGLSRSIVLPPATTGISTLLPTAQPNQLLAFNSSGTAITSINPVDVLTVAGSSGFSTQAFNGTGVQTVFTLSASPGAIANLEVFISGVRQRPTTDYTLSGNSLTFGTAPASGTSNILCRWGTTLGIGIPSDTSVTTAKLADSSVSTVKLADSAVTTVKLADSAVTTVKIADANVTTAKIADSNVTAAKLASGAAVTNIGYTPANDSAVVHTTGDETVAGVKTFSSQPVLPQALTRATAQNTTSGTSIDFTGIPSWVKRITVMFNGVSTSGTNSPLIQLGAGSVDTTGYVSDGIDGATSVLNGTSTAGFRIGGGWAATANMYGSVQLCAVGSNAWVAQGCVTRTDTGGLAWTTGGKTLSGSLDRIRLTTIGGTDTFDAGSVNILYE